MGRVVGSHDPISNFVGTKILWALVRLKQTKADYNSYQLFSLLVQSVQDLIIANLPRLTNLTGLENLAQYGNELSILNNQRLTTLRQLSSNLPPEHRITVRSIGIRDNPLLEDVEGLSYVSNVTGKNPEYESFSENYVVQYSYIFLPFFLQASSSSKTVPVSGTSQASETSSMSAPSWWPSWAATSLISMALALCSRQEPSSSQKMRYETLVVQYSYAMLRVCGQLKHRR